MLRFLCFAVALAAAQGPWDDDYRALASHHLAMPVEGANPKEIQDTFRDARSGGGGFAST